MRQLITSMFTAVALGSAIVGTACSTQSVTERYANELSQVHPGISLSDFRLIMPKAIVAGQNLIGGNRIDAYEVSHEHMYDTSLGLTREEKLWFYFMDEKLVKWGPPGAWPERADLVVETRSR